jgi:hypothetical protein
MTIPPQKQLLQIAGGAAAAILVALLLLRGTLHDVNIRANEDQALMDIVEFAALENQYAMANGAYALPEAMGAPARRFTWPVRNGYRFVLRPDAPGVELLESSTFVTYKYVAYPVMEGAVAPPSYYYDNTNGRVHARTDGLEPSNEDVQVWPPPSDQPVQQ